MNQQDFLQKPKPSISICVHADRDQRVLFSPPTLIYAARVKAAVFRASIHLAGSSTCKECQSGEKRKKGDRNWAESFTPLDKWAPLGKVFDGSIDGDDLNEGREGYVRVIYLPPEH